MDIDRDLGVLRRQEAELVFSRFDETDAFAIGAAIRGRGVGDNWPIVVDVRFWDRPLFYAALPGSSAGNVEWVRRKTYAVRMFGRSSYRMLFERGGERLLPADSGFDPRDYAFHGGSFPVTVAGVGIVGAITVSGLHERADHGVVVEAICAHLGKDAAALALSPP